MAQTILTPTMITREALRLLVNNLVLARNVNRQYDDRFAQDGAKIGTALQIRLPNKFTVRTGAALAVQNLAETYVTLNLATQKGVDVNFSSAELSMSLDDFSKRVLTPAMARLASQIDFEVGTLYQDVYNCAGTANTTAATALCYLQAGQKLDEFATPRDGNRHAIMAPAAIAATVDALKGLFQSSEHIREQYEKGLMGEALGFDILMDQNINAHTAGTRLTTGWTVGATAVDGDDHIHLYGGSGNSGLTWAVGDVFTCAGVYARNPDNGQSTGALQQFVVTALATAGTGGNYEAVVSVAPTIKVSTTTYGGYATINRLPTASDAVVVTTGTPSLSTSQNLAFHRDAFVLATADLEVPKGVDFAAREVYEGISLRVVRQYDINNDAFPCRLDVYYGMKTVRPEMACRIIGTSA
jgi:hypothetical protein